MSGFCKSGHLIEAVPKKQNSWSHRATRTFRPRISNPMVERIAINYSHCMCNSPEKDDKLPRRAHLTIMGRLGGNLKFTGNER